MEKLSVVVAGASGLVGNELRKALSERVEVSELVLLSRAPLESLGPRMKNVVVDYNRLEDFLSEFKADVFMCCLGTTLRSAGSPDAFKKVDYGYVLDFARCAQRVGAKQFHLVSAVGADETSPFLYAQTKGRIEVDVAKLRLPELKIYRPSILLGTRTETRIFEAIGQALSPVSNLFLFGPFRKYRGISAVDVARAMVKVFLESRVSSSSTPVVFESDKMQETANLAE